MKKLKIYSLQQYIDAGKAETGSFLIEELLPESRIGMLVGPAKSNKTTIAYMIGKAVADTNVTECLGHKVLTHGNVLYIALEGGLGPQINAFGICEHFGVIDDKFFTLDTPGNLKIIEECISSNNIKLLIIDALYKAMDGNIANADEVRPLLMNLEDLSRKHKVTILMLHHTNRATGKVEQNMNDVSGSFNIVRSSEFTMMLSIEDKTEEEEIAEANMSKEEYAKLPRKRILKKLDYRDGGEGYDKYSIDIYFGTGDRNGYIDGYKYKSNRIKAKPTDRTEDLINCAIDILTRIDKFNKRDLSKLLAENYSGLTESSIEKNYTKKVIDALSARNLIKRINKNEGYKSLMYKDNSYEQIPF